jgi:hypothetical protein
MGQLGHNVPWFLQARHAAVGLQWIIPSLFIQTLPHLLLKITYILLTVGLRVMLKLPERLSFVVSLLWNFT